MENERNQNPHIVNEENDAVETEEVSPESEKSVEEEIALLKDQLLRSLAELDNTRKRAQKDREEASKYAVSSFARDLLVVADTFARALAATPQEGVADHAALKALFDGVQMTERELHSVLTRHGVQKIGSVGQVFDPNVHQAIFEVPTDQMDAGVVAQEVQAGYTLHGRLLRPAMVGVAKPLE